MSVTIEQQLAGVICACISNQAKKNRPSLCYETEAINSNKFIAFILETISDGNIDIFLVLSHIDGLRVAELVSEHDLCQVIPDKLKKLNTVGVVNPTTGDGFTIDCNSFTRENISDLTLISTGKYEFVSEQAYSRFPEGTLFRGN